MSNLGRYQSTRDTPASNASRESHCLMRILVWRNHRSVFLPKRSVAITINGERYRSMISFLWPKMDDMDTDNMWFQQDGAICHTPHATMDILHKQFEDMVISRGSDVNWPPRSCDLTPFYLKSSILNRRSIRINRKQLMLSKTT